MCAVFKEEVYELEELEANQVQIFNDALDIGLNDTPELRKQMRELIENLPDGTKSDIQTSTGGRKFVTHVVWDRSDGMVNFTIIQIHWYRTPQKHSLLNKEMKAYWNIYTESKYLPVNRYLHRLDQLGLEKHI